MSLSTHVLDLRSGLPASGISVMLNHENTLLAQGVTDADGRYADFFATGALQVGQYQMTFHVGPYFAAQSVETFYDHIPVLFVVQDAARHHHVPLLLSPFGYSTYRGS
ncbi:MAG: hydroxyisourate hydrolase [Pseudomonadota bacterium]